MFVILTYDVDKKRDGKMLKICRRYLRHSQKSVFEGIITESKLKHLKSEIKGIIKPDSDSVNIYLIGSLKYCAREQIGVFTPEINIL